MKKRSALVLIVLSVSILLPFSAPPLQASDYLGELCLYISFGAGMIPTPMQFSVSHMGGGHLFLSGRFYPFAMTVPVMANLEFTATEAIIGYTAAYVLPTSKDPVSETGLITIDLGTLEGTADIMKVRYSSPSSPDFSNVAGSVTLSPCPM